MRTAVRWPHHHHLYMKQKRGAIEVSRHKSRDLSDSHKEKAQEFARKHFNENVEGDYRGHYLRNSSSTIVERLFRNFSIV